MIDGVRATSGQRWLLAVIAVLSPVIACIVIGAATDFTPTAVAVIVGLLAIASAVRPDTHIAVFVIVVVVVFWLARIDDVTTPWALIVAVALFAYHAVISLMSTAPSSAVFDHATVRTWLRRSFLVVVGTVAVWGLVLALDQGRRPGNGLLSLAALAALMIAIVLVRARSVSRQDR
jgi:hypothetical protein